MMLQPWIISVLSTAYDLQEYRKAVIAMLKEKKFTVSAYELPEFPVEQKLHSHDSCLTALKRVDLAIVIIDKRSGGTYCGIEDNKDKISITEVEYLEAIRIGIPVYIFVNKKSYDELFAYKKGYNQFCNDKGYKSEDPKDIVKYRNEFDKIYICTYVEKVQTLHFIEDVQNSFTENKVSNWMYFFTNIDDLKEAVEGKLYGYSRMLIQNLAEEQKKSLLNRHTSTAIGMSLGDVFTSEFYIEPPHKIVSGNALVSHKDLSGEIKGILSTNNSVLIYGEAGYGKTTILAKCFSEHVDSLQDNPTYDIPLFLPLRNKGHEYHFDINNYLVEDIAELLSREKYPYLDIGQLKIRFYCDGFDELAESLSPPDLDRIRNSTIFKYPIVLTCRQQYTTRYLNEYNFSDKFGVRIQMGKWDSKILKEYVKNFCLRKKIDSFDEKEIIKALEDNKDLQEMLDSPLLITMFMWFLENQQGTSNISNISRVQLFNCWMTDLSKREHSKTAVKKTTSDTILNVWEYSAWMLYTHRVLNQKLRIDDLAEMISTSFPEIGSNNVMPWFEALFECTTEYINGTFHEQFMEYLVARLLINACENKSEPYPDFMKMVIRPEINRYFRGIWGERSRVKKEKIFEAIESQYFDNSGKDDDSSVAIRVHAVYHISRLDSQKRKGSIDRAFNVERHISVLLSLYFGAIKMGRLDKEETFYNLLINEEDYSKANRGYHLAYYADMIVGEKMPYIDDECSEWQGTLRAFERHFDSDEIAHYYLRRIDLLTMRQLIKVRKCVSPLTDDKLTFFKEKIKNCKYSSLPEYSSYNQNILNEFNELLKLVENIKK